MNNQIPCEQSDLFMFNQFSVHLCHGEEGGAKLETKGGVESLPINICRGRTSEGGQEDMRAARVIARLLEGVCHHVVD